MVSLPFLSRSTNEETPVADGRDAQTQEPVNQERRKPLDIVFLQDTTGSQGPYIKAARQAIRDICDKISASAQFPKDSELLRFGLIAFRDHPPQDPSYVTKDFGFTSSIETMQKSLTSLIASGGGDGPEAQTAALAAALNLDWKDDAIKVVILITDSPPHGLGENGDGFQKSPDQNDPLDMARQMAERGITLFVVACEPALSSYSHALDFYSALVQITSGRLLPLLMADKLGDYIVASAIETIETEQLIGEFEHVILDDVYGKFKSIENVMAEVHQTLQNRGTQLQTMELEKVYVENEQATKNREVWFSATSIGQARSKIQPVSPTPYSYSHVYLNFHLDKAMSSYSALVSLGYPTAGHTGPVRTSRSALRGRGRGGTSHPYGTRSSSITTSDPSPSTDIPASSAVLLQQQVMQMKQMQMRRISSAIPQQQMQMAQMASVSLPVAQQHMQMAQMSQMSQAMPAAQQQQQQPKLTLERANLSMSQAHRIVMQSLTRNSKVTATGLVSKKGETAGQQVAMGPYKEIDIVFLQDATGSQGPYIKAARNAVRDICSQISSCTNFPKDFIRFGLIAFRDHPPQDMTYVIKEFGFTSDMEVMAKNLASLTATGGGDGPEAQTAALAGALNLEWNEDATKMVVLITDSPPHGLGETGDGFDKSPDQNDPLDIARQMAERGITLFVIACEPSIRQEYKYALNFYYALTQITGGRVYPLLLAERLGKYIVGTAVETIETERLISEFQDIITSDVYEKGRPIEEVMSRIQQTLQNRGVQLQTLMVDDVYKEGPMGSFYRSVWFEATSLEEGRKRIRPVGVCFVRARLEGNENADPSQSGHRRLCAKYHIVRTSGSEGYPGEDEFQLSTGPSIGDAEFGQKFQSDGDRVYFQERWFKDSSYRSIQGDISLAQAFEDTLWIFKAQDVFEETAAGRK
ncbi:hypothetical protein CVT24_003825 [Panaeolus cyanescens]|uniref:VWFA domain-containing protein n=1 Tax=Panaeolus cyanescens TaxID=181874 RepID=A0A409W831_9AGAR|nr:hypothetical protein CVT24_003825 [Panaeolus cyanescens]